MSTTQLDTGPQALNEFIGQENAKTQALTAIIKAQHLHQPLVPILLTGPSGYGKTTFAELIATAAGVPFRSLIWPPSTQNALAYELIHTSGVVLLDEIHRSTNKHEWLFEPMSKHPRIRYGHSVVDLENLTIIGATTDVHTLGPLRRRFLLELDFVEYTEDEMIQVLTGKLERSGFPLSEADVTQLAKACAGKPGMSERITDAVVGLTLQHGQTDAGGVFEHLGMDADGLEAKHRRYLCELYKYRSAAVGLDAMVSVLDLPKGAVTDIERLLKHQGFVDGHADGRVLTPAGHARVKTIKREWGV